MIDVIVPVVQTKLAEALFRSMDSNNFLPATLSIIDNTVGGLNGVNFPKKVSVITLRPPQRLGTNASWEIGRKYAGPNSMVSILNDDIILGPDFFRLLDIASGLPDHIAVFCPQTVKTPQQVRGSNEMPTISSMIKREGWAFSIRASVWRQIPPIPAELKMFCGDDWIWYWTHKLGYQWARINNSYIFHHVGVSVKETGTRGLLEPEKRRYAEIIAALEKKK